MNLLNLKRLTAGALGALTGTSTALAWTVAVDNFDAYDDGVALREQTGHGGVGFAGDWVETHASTFWTPLYATTSDEVFGAGMVIQNGRGVMAAGGRHMRALSHPQNAGVVYISTLILNGIGGSNQLQIYSDLPIKDAEGNVQQGLSDLIAGVRYDRGVIQIIDTSYAHVPDDPETTDVNESRNLDALIPGRDGLTDDDPPQIAYNEYYTLGETYVDIAGRDELIDTDILWVMAYDMDASTISYYAFLPGDELTPEGASYSVIDHPVNAARKLTLGTVAVAAYGVGGYYDFVKVGTTWGDVVPVYNEFAHASMVREPVVVDGEVDDLWNDLPAQSYGLKQGDGSQPADAADASGTWKAAWDLNNLYLLFEVIDDEHVEGTDDRQDEIEFWTDTDLSRNNTDGGWPPVYDKTDTQWITRFVSGAAESFANRWQHNGSALPADRKDISELGDDSMVVEGVIEPLDAGGVRKIVEVSVAWADLGMAGPPELGQLIGFETQINDRDASTGTDSESNPLYESDGKVAWADGNNRAWLSPSSFGVLAFTPPITPILSYDFTDLTVGEPAAEAGIDDDNWAGPWVEAWRPAWATTAANGAEAAPFIGNLAQDGQGIVGVNAGRLSRTMDVTYVSGMVWTSFVLGNDTASTQLWLGDAAKFDLNDNSGIAAGVRMQRGSVQVINTTLSRDTLENYVNVGVYPNAPVLAVVLIDYQNSKVGYWIFESGLPLDPSNPSAFYEFELPRNMALNPYTGFAWAGFSGRAVISNLRVGDQLNQVIPDAGMEYNCPVLVSELHEPVIVDGSLIDFAWERTNGLEITNFWSDDGANVLPAGDADFAAAFHTGWNGDMLYIAVTVDDEEVRNLPADANRDSVEIYLDGDNSDSDSLGWPTNFDQVDDFQLVFALNSDRDDGADLTGSWFGNPTGNPDGYKGLQGANEGQDFDGISWQASMTETGYIIEIALDMTVVPGLDTFLANGLMGLDVSVVDNDDTGELDAENNPVIEKSHAFFCDDANWNWNGTAHFGTAHVAGAMPPIAMFGAGEANILLEGDATAASEIHEVNTNFTDVAYSIAANQPWVTIDFDPGIGAGEVEFSWEENTGLYQRAARIELSGPNVLNRIDLRQAGIAPETMKPFFPGATSGDSPGMADGYMGSLYYSAFPWVYTSQMHWLHLFEGTSWMFSQKIADYIYTSEAIYPILYLYGAGSQPAGWKYLLWVEGFGGYLYDYNTGLFSDEVVFPE